MTRRRPERGYYARWAMNVAVMAALALVAIASVLGGVYLVFAFLRLFFAESSIVLGIMAGIFLIGAVNFLLMARPDYREPE